MPERRPPKPPAPDRDRAALGIKGLDEILGGGLPRHRIYLLDGEPGTGKTTAALQFLLAGKASGEGGMYVALSETTDELSGAAASHGWSLDGLTIVELSALQEDRSDEAYTLFHPAEVELQHTVDAVLQQVERHQPARVVFDSLSEMRMLARDPLRFRRQILALKQFFAGRDCTVLLIDDRTHPAGDLQLQSLAHGVIQLEHLAMEYGAERRRLQVTKLRGVRFQGGYHDFRIRTGGIEVYPRIIRHANAPRRPPNAFSSGSEELDKLVGSGLPSGTSTLVMGSAGAGKSILCMQYALRAARSGTKTRVYLFDERTATALTRARGLDMDPTKLIDDGMLSLRQIEPTEMSPGEFAQDIVCAIEEDGVGLLVIDSINGSLQAMPAERLLLVQLHELLSYLADRGVTMLMTLVQYGVFGGHVDEAAEVSYLADTVLLLRYFEFSGSVRRAMSVVKKRSGTHESTIREFVIGTGGIRVGDPLRAFRGVLTGVPEYTGRVEPLLAETPAKRD